jgi:hypothetical protein
VRYVLVLACAACGSSGHVAADASVDACAGSLPLVVTPQRLHVMATHDGAPAMLLVDTGSPTTFLQEPLGSPDPVHHAGTIGLGCTTLELDGRPVVADDPVAGVPTIGTFGVDRLLPGPTTLDIAGAAIASGEPDAAAAWPTASYDVALGLVLAHVALDGRPVRLMLDTGSPATLWLGEQPQPGDVEVDTTDAVGNVVRLYAGTATLTIGATTTTIDVLRAPSFPYLEQTVADLGGNVAGLLGLSALGHGFVLDGELRVAP